MPHASLFDTAIDNRGLFPDYYLTERFPREKSKAVGRYLTTEQTYESTSEKYGRDEDRNVVLDLGQPDE